MGILGIFGRGDTAVAFIVTPFIQLLTVIFNGLEILANVHSEMLFFYLLVKGFCPFDIIIQQGIDEMAYLFSALRADGNVEMQARFNGHCLGLTSGKGLLVFG